MHRTTVRNALLSFAFGLAGAMALSQSVSGTPEIAQKERQGCLVCHTALGKADLSDRGRYYKAERTLEGYRPPESPTPSPEPAPPATPRPDDGVRR